MISDQIKWYNIIIIISVVMMHSVTKKSAACRKLKTVAEETFTNRLGANSVKQKRQREGRKSHIKKNSERKMRIS